MGTSLKSFEIHKLFKNFNYPDMILVDFNKTIEIKGAENLNEYLIRDLYGVRPLGIVHFKNSTMLIMDVNVELYYKVYVTYELNGEEQKVTLSEFVNIVTMLLDIDKKDKNHNYYEIKLFENIETMEITLRYKLETNELYGIYVNVFMEKK